MRIWRMIGSGAVAGATSALVFAFVHDVLISDIWFSLVPMVAAGVLCGGSLGWSFGLLFETPTTRSWIGFNLAYDGLFGVLAIVSIFVYEPVTTVAALIETNEFPADLIGRALPLIVVFTISSAAVIWLVFGRRPLHILAVLVTTTLLIVFLGLNVSIIGLVAIPTTSLYLIFEMLALILTINVVFAGMFVLLERRNWPGSVSFVNQSGGDDS